MIGVDPDRMRQGSRFSPVRETNRLSARLRSCSLVLYPVPAMGL